MKNKSLIIIGIVVVAIIAAIVVFFFVNGGTSNKNVEGTLDELMTKLYSGISEEELPRLEKVPVTKENVSYFLGTDSLEFKEALASEPMISSIAHSIVLIRANENSDIEAMKTKIKESVDPRKWICVEVEKDNVIVDSKGDLIVLIMVNEHVDKIYENFKNL